MKRDRFSTLIREKHQPPDHIANRGDSCADTCRAIVLGEPDLSWGWFVVEQGYLRHPELQGIVSWNEADFSNDQFLPLLMVLLLNDPTMFSIVQSENKTKIRGTNTILSAGCWALLRKQFWLLNLINIVQGWILKLPYRWSDNEQMKGKFFKFEKTHGESADYLNYIVIYVFLKRMKKWATLNRPVDECLSKVEDYCLNGNDFEPNSQWIVDLYRKALS